MNKKRTQSIEEILQDLSDLRARGVSNKYALEENICFFEAAKNLGSYFKWLITRAPKIDVDRVLELTDFDLPRWEKELHLNLIEMSKRSFPGLVKPIRNYIIKFIAENNPLFILDVGSGSMEIERQIIELLLKNGSANRPVFIGLDSSNVACEIAKENLSGFDDPVEVYELQNLDDIWNFRSENKPGAPFKIILLNKTSSLLFQRANKQFDLIFYSKFRHHLPVRSREEFDVSVKKAAKTFIEYDDYKSFIHLIPQSFGAWKFPVLMNGAIFSRLRCPTKLELRTGLSDGQKIKFSSFLGSYLKVSGH